MNKLSKIFSESDCLSEQKIFDYVNENISGNERFTIEKHLSDCEICKDIAEGYSILKSKTSLQSDINELNTKIDNRIRKKIGTDFQIIRNIENPNLRIKRIFAIAASIVLFASVGLYTKYYFDKMAKNELAYNTSQKEEVSAGSKLEGNTNSNEKFKEMKIASSENYNNNTNSKKLKENVVVDYENDEIIEDKGISKNEEFLIEPVENVSIDDVVVAEESKTELSKMKSEKNIEEENNKIVADDVDNSNTRHIGFAKKDSYKSGSSNENKTVGNAASGESTISILTRYGNARDLFDEKRYEEAILIFEEIINSNDSFLVEESQWYKALAFLNSGKSSDAKKLLKKISKSKSKRKADAIEKLKSINN